MKLDSGRYASLTIVNLLLTIFSSGISVEGATCTEILGQLLVLPECTAYQTAIQKAGPDAAQGDCNSVRSLGKQYFPNDVPVSCCPSIRQLITQGCICDAALIKSLGALASATPDEVQKALTGAARLGQTSICATDSNGGPMVNSCDGTTSPC